MRPYMEIEDGENWVTLQWQVNATIERKREISSSARDAYNLSEIDFKHYVEASTDSWSASVVIFEPDIDTSTFENRGLAIIEKSIRAGTSIVIRILVGELVYRGECVVVQITPDISAHIRYTLGQSQSKNKTKLDFSGIGPLFIDEMTWKDHTQNEPR